jgi:hypothetical protein
MSRSIHSDDAVVFYHAVGEHGAVGAVPALILAFIQSPWAHYLIGRESATLRLAEGRVQLTPLLPLYSAKAAARSERRGEPSPNHWSCEKAH